MLGWLLRRLAGGVARQRPDLRFLVYSRANCHLCDEAWDLLVAAQRTYGFPLDQKDVDSDPKLVADYGDCVPVVLVNDKVRFRGKVNPALLEKLLQGK
jgi:hypothetical protein